MARADECPSEEELAAFAGGSGAEVEREALRAHATGCSRCAAWLSAAADDEALLHDVREAIAQPGSTEGTTPPAPSLDAGSEVAGYRLVRKLGEGGMGIVFEAEQQSPRRRVALKLVRHAFPSLRLLRRFELEAEVLGRLQHPGIAQIYAAGTFAAIGGPQPFFAMELVSGVSLLEHVRRLGLDVRARLGLLAQICDALHHAHQKGVVHRDLKPGNVLVTASGQTKVLDFGVARLGDDGETRTSAATLPGQLVGTLPYMSPEQIVGPDVDVRSDVYSLGVLAYEVLTGVLPYRFGAGPRDGSTASPAPRAPATAGHESTSGSSGTARQNAAEQARVIVEQDPVPLGMVDPRLRGDLDTIVRKALAKDRDHRYGSAAELAADVRRWLAFEPIAARPPSTIYHLRRFARRNRALVAGAAATFAVLVLGIVATWTQAVRANDRQREAERRLRQAVAARDFLQEVLVQGAPQEQVGAAEPTVRQALLTAIGRVHQIESPAVEAGVRHTLGKVMSGLGDYPRAQQELERALVLYEQEQPREWTQIVFVLADLTDVYNKRGDYDAAERTAQRALSLRGRLGPTDHPVLVSALSSLASTHYLRGHLQSAERWMREAIAVCERQSNAQLREFNVPFLTTHLALMLDAQGRQDEAERLYREAIPRLCSVAGDRNPLLASALNNFAGLLQRQGDRDEAERLLREALAIRTAALGEEHDETALTGVSLGALQFDRGQRDEGLGLARQNLARLRARLGAHPRVVQASCEVSRMLGSAGQREEAEALLREALAMAAGEIGARHPLTNRARSELGTLLVRRNPAEAAGLLREALVVAREDQPQMTSMLVNTACSCAQALKATGDRAGAEQCMTETLAQLDAAIASGGRGPAQGTASDATAGRGPTGAAASVPNPLAVADRRRLLQALASFYDACGRSDDAARCRERLARDQ